MSQTDTDVKVTAAVTSPFVLADKSTNFITSFIQ